MDITKLKVSKIIDMRDAIKIANFIKDENKIKSHMIEKSPEEILKSAMENWCLKLSINDEIVWFMWLYKYGKFYEAWSLCIWEKYRNKWLWTMLQKKLFEHYSDLAVFLVTNVWEVKSMTKTSNLKEIKISQIPENILKSIESWWKILSDDSVYFNKKLYLNDFFYSIIEKQN